ncbi:MAG: MFS transporter [Planctomycetales bacterium]|nr:MFS transporter [Planctomycetales bacterium]
MTSFPATVTPNSPAEEPEERTSSPYNATFAACYIANTATMIAVSCTFRYDDFVHLHGGTAFDLGLIVGLGTLGALTSRAMQAFGLDRIGPRVMWLSCLAVYIGSVLFHTQLDNVTQPPVYIARMMMMLGLAGAFGASLTFVSQAGPVGRMGELLGMLGTSGFVGLAIGPSLSDWLLGDSPQMSDINRMFYTAAGLASLAWSMAWWATRHAPRPVERRWPSLSSIRQFHSGTLLIVAAAMGLGLSLPGVFVRSFVRQAGLGGIGRFFLVYATVALIVRIATRSASDRIGIRPVVLTGMCFLSASMMSFLLVSTSATLVIPAMLTGVAHALLFPAVVSGGNLSFPLHYRGLATTLTLAMFDVGNLIGQPLAGLSVRIAELSGLPPHGTMFVVVATLIGTAAAIYAIRPPRVLSYAEAMSREAASDDGQAASAVVTEAIVTDSCHSEDPVAASAS